MKNKVFNVVVLFLLLALFSCVQENIHDNPEVVIDANKLNDSLIPVSENSKIRIKNMDESIVYGLEIRSGGRNINSRAKTDKSFFRTNTGRCIPIPDENNESKFTGYDVGVRGKEAVRLIKLKNGNSDEMTLDEENLDQLVYSDSWLRIYEEFYHIDFTKEPFSKLDLSEIIISSYGSGSGSGFSDFGYVTIGEGGVIGGHTSAYNIFNFSDKNSINLFSTLGVEGISGIPQKFKLKITNPIELEIGSNLVLDSDHVVVSLKEQPGGVEYVFEIEKEDRLYYSDYFFLRGIDGLTVDFPLLLKEENEKLIYYLGPINERLFCDFTSVPEEYFSGNNYGKVELKEIDSDLSELYSDRVLTVDLDKLNTQGSITLSPISLDVNNREQQFKVNPDSKLHNVFVSVQYKGENGEELDYSNDYFWTNVKSSHTHRIGLSNDGKLGKHVLIQIIGNDCLEILTLHSYIDEDVEATITIYKID